MKERACSKRKRSELIKQSISTTIKPCLDYINLAAYHNDIPIATAWMIHTTHATKHSSSFGNEQKLD